ncbi:MAG: hypothetical protein JWO93_945 [Micrococcaceae bacterium]|jgi:hypothetical protein|nr:hypothetical protein [Micrococcaceae bacterium]
MTASAVEQTRTEVGVRVRFERIRQNRNIPDLHWSGTDALQLEQAIKVHAMPYMDYPDFGVHLNGSTGWIDAGVYNAGNFEVVAAGAVEAPAEWDSAGRIGTAKPGTPVDLGWAALSGPAAWGLGARS